MITEDVLVIVRSSGERTEKACIHRLQEIFGKQSVVLIKGIVPFSEAVRESFKVALEADKKWTLVVDADVLLSDNIVSFLELCNEYSQEHKKAFAFGGLLYDKFLLQNRVVGAHLYRTKYIGKAMKYVDAGSRKLRPETYVKKEMQKRGYDVYICNIVIGLHDFFQYNRDIFRKGILHSKKHGGIDELYIMWQQLQGNDTDYYWMCEGVNAGKKLNVEDVIVDLRFFQACEEEYSGNFDLPQDELTDERVSEAIKKYGSSCIESVQIFEQPWKRWSMIKSELKSRIRDFIHF